MTHIFLLKEVYLSNTHWTLFARNIFEVIDGVLNMSYPNFKCDGIPIEQLPPDSFMILDESELELAQMLYWEPTNPHAT